LGISSLAWFDRQGKELGTAGELGMSVYMDIVLSPDGSRVAESRADTTASAPGIWLLDLARGVSARFTFDLAEDTSPIWSPDGSRIAYAAFRPGGVGIYQKAANGAGKEETLIAPSSDPIHTEDWSHDGRFLLYTREDAKTRSDLWVLPCASDGTAAGSPMAFANSEFNESRGRFSPNDHWIAYTSDESGKSEVYIQRFQAPAERGGKLQISRDGGRLPHWRRDGRELFYLSLDGKIMAVDIGGDSSVKAGVPRFLFKVPGGEGQSDFYDLHWDVTPDGKRFLISTTKTSSEALTVVLNWTAGLKKK
jgi:Tol biopolymer transport system component